ncbi:MAG: STAS domain-containing protein [Ruminococcus flavefaciens]|nr:MAG: putative anti-sigma factor antagonist BtrV [Firmicutes bacterium ADurb.BinA205]HOC33660.1 STAS domain-containing protein [Ruminococcus flavefaciens]HQM00897.1 STAS domain-containing protein [Ruminococcus flavefaciens]
MDIKMNSASETLTLEIKGRIDTKSAPQLEEIIGSSLDGVRLLVMDFEGVEYVSSAGLRVLLIAQKAMNRQGDMKVRNVNPDIMEIFEVTGFSDILTIE